jgi:hypothetical protein
MPDVGRLAFRDEGKFWVCYFTKLDTLVDAIPLGSIRMNIVESNDEIRTQFMDLMKNIMSKAVEHATGRAPDYFDERPAPEHERTKK